MHRLLVFRGPVSARFAARVASVVALIVVLGLSVSACDPGFPQSKGDPGVTEAQFIDAVVLLRREAIGAPMGQLTLAERDRLLAERGLRAEMLQQFVEVHGVNVPYMGGVWTTIEQRLNEQVQGGMPVPAPSAPGGFENLDEIPALGGEF